ncbi:MAG: hypothetical protein ACFFBD_28715, partial [Candidatus Hodarchaeota archaeon]
MKSIYLSAFLGIILVGMLAIGGFILAPFIETWFFESNNNNWLPPRRYSIDLEYHNYSSLELPITTLKVVYREFNSSLLQHPDPYFVGILITRESIDKNRYQNNDTMWKILPFHGFRYNEWNCSDAWGADNRVQPALYAHHNYIAYEVDKFAQLFFEAFFTAESANDTGLGYQFEEVDVPAKWVLSVEVKFNNGSFIHFEGHKDGWLRSITFECMNWSITDNGISYCMA